MELTFVLSLYASIVATYYLYTRVERLIRHWRYSKWIEKEKSSPAPPIRELNTIIDNIQLGVTLPYEVGDKETDVMDSDEREWKAEQEFKNKRGE